MAKQVTQKEHADMLQKQREMGVVLRGVIMDLHINQIAINRSMEDEHAVMKITARMYHDRLVGINKALYDTELSLAERVNAYFTDKFDAAYAKAIAYRWGLTLSDEAAAKYDVTKYLKFNGDMRIELTGDDLVNFVQYLRSIGATVNSPKINPATDGVNHINVYSKGTTSVGRTLSNFHTPELPYQTEHGEFRTLEGLYHWLRVAEYHCTHRGNSIATIEVKYPELKGLRTADGLNAIRLGRTCKAAAYSNTNYRPGKFTGRFYRSFVRALVDKLSRHYEDGVCLGATVSNLKVSGYKIVHYYATAEGIKYPKHGEWLPELIDELCTYIDPMGGEDCMDILKSKLPELIGE